MDFRPAALAWLTEDPDPVTRDQLQRVLAAEDDAELAALFGARLAFGTAGLRGQLGPGPNRMNRATVRRVGAGLAARLKAGAPDTTPIVVVGRDARHGSADFADDTAAVLAGAGMAVRRFPDVVPTPLVAWAVRTLEADAGVMITASHNPPADNGYKVFAPGGSQIRPPLDTEIADAIDAVGSLTEVPLADLDVPLVQSLGHEVIDAYVDAVKALVEPGNPRDLRIVFSALHGVSGSMCVRILEEAGFADVHVVPEQQEPDPDFPTVAFPNPEEPGAMDLAIALAGTIDADLVLANDPDGDRIAVGIAGPDGWRLLTGDEIGCLLAEDLLSRASATGGPAAHVATTVVSSTLLAEIAAHHGAAFHETLTGFKWLSEAAEQAAEAGGVMVLAYEQALGVSVGDVVRDKDGMSAALAVADLAARLKADGRTLRDVLDDLAIRYGAHVTAGRSVALEAAEGQEDLVQAVLDSLRADPPTSLGGSPVTTIWDHDAGIVSQVDGTIDGIDLPTTPLLRYRAQDGTMVMVRPSGTEPKLKFYAEAVVSGDDPAAARRAATERVEGVLDGFVSAALPG